jgi:hypothetical protein
MPIHIFLAFLFGGPLTAAFFAWVFSRGGDAHHH